ncbi:MAG TPA: toll/interleukin-1 receptor domain-containing protein, partial [Nitrospiraceae bacterium]|nr:toll/interleukin-1 receptor domain-containing protein [Nitrospiraceae bacterium]
MPASPRDLTFISYSHKDKVWLDRLLDTLKPLVRKGSVALWADTQIRPGDQWRDEIKRALSSAKVAVLLVSTNFLASDFIAKHELPPLLKRAKAGGLTVLWVHLSSSLYEEMDIEGYQAAHDIAKPLDSLSESEQAKVLVEIARKIRDAVARKEEGPSPDGSQEAIKGLRPFRHEDAEIFARLGRQREVEDCARTIGDPEFRFGILSGESGCGKSSFLQAGLWPKLEAYWVPHRCLYVKFTNEDPFETLKRAVSKSLEIPLEDLRQLDFLAVLKTAVQADPKPLVLLFDQFEQFFVHRKFKQDRQPFVLALADWYRNGADLPVKILVCIRGDFSDRLTELQTAMGYSIVPGQNVRLEKFEPPDAASVIKQIARVEGLPVEEDFVESMVKELAGREDGLISPAYLQIMAWVLGRQKEPEKREFTSRAFQKLGGVEGLLDRFLADALDARPGDASKQTVLKILVALIDLDRNAR